jgi:hypothetical protein
MVRTPSRHGFIGIPAVFITTGNPFPSRKQKIAEEKREKYTTDNNTIQKHCIQFGEAILPAREQSTSNSASMSMMAVSKPSP